MLKLQKKLPTTTHNLEIFVSRQKKLRQILFNEDVEYFVTSSKVDLRYLTGYNGSNGLALFSTAKTYFFTDTRYETIIEKEVLADKKIIAKGGLLNFALKKNILKNKISFDPNSFLLSDYFILKNNFSEKQLIKLPMVIDRMMSVKSEDEILKIKKAVQITDIVFQEILKIIKPGISEKDISNEITYKQQSLGAECDSFPPIIAFRENSALPHAIPTNKKISKGVVLLDFGARVCGYNSDLSRTLYFGNAPTEFKKNYEILFNTQIEAINFAKVGITGSKLDSVARNYLKKFRLEKYFTHSVGHGLSMKIHALPRLSKVSSDILENRNVITIEPGIYFKNKYGIRIEDVILIKNKPEVLSKSPKQLIEL